MCVCVHAFVCVCVCTCAWARMRVCRCILLCHRILLFNVQIIQPCRTPGIISTHTHHMK
ncbi:hypothetical protein AMTRI_Chr10g4570 [Amborella trichopoda]